MWQSILRATTTRERHIHRNHCRSSLWVAKHQQTHHQQSISYHGHAFSSVQRQSSPSFRQFSTHSTSPIVALQLDYYMSLQFAGVANALVNDLYKKKGLGEIEFLPICPVGLEMARVREFQDANPSSITLGSVEQNIFTPLLYRQPDLNVKAVASTFRRSPLCVASLQPLQPGDVIGAHEDTVELLQRIFTKQQVVPSPRNSKVSDLLAGKYAGIQAYTTTEVPALYRHLEEKNDYSPSDLNVTALEGYDGTTQLGYSQLLFASQESLESAERREITTAFLEATFDGWQQAIKDPQGAIQAVQEAQARLNLDLENNDHWHSSKGFQEEMLQLVLNHVKETFQGDRLGCLDTNRWSRATNWLLDNEETVDGELGLDTSNIWQPPSHLLAGNELARKMLEEAKVSAQNFATKYGRKPSVAVLSVGELPRYSDAPRRIQLYSNPSNSWFSKKDSGNANGFDVVEIQLDAETTTTDSLLSEIYKIRDKVDGIQAMWPFPEHVDSARVFDAIPKAKDVDGIHFVGQLELGNPSAYPPLAPAAAMALIKNYNVSVQGKKVLVVGRSRIVGSPMAHLLREAGAAVSVVHTEVPRAKLEEMVRNTEVLVNCAGNPGIIKADWIVDGTDIINIGTTFSPSLDQLQSDVAGEISTNCRWSPVPGGVGPLSVPLLFKNAAKAAWKQMEDTGKVVGSWEQSPAILEKKFHFDSYTEALDFASQVDEFSTFMDHHANMSFIHKCVNGVDLKMDFFSYEAKELTEKDFDAAKAIEILYKGNEINMSDYSYDLDPKAIAKYPAEPRGSSKLLRVDFNGEVSYHANFSKTIPTLLQGCHLVLNDSLVLDARLAVNLPQGGPPVELMILDLGSAAPGFAADRQDLDAMIRSDSVKKGDVLVEPQSGAKVEVMDVCGIWEEDAESGGNGMKCIVRIHVPESLVQFLDEYGETPIPPYFQRAAEEADKERYNNVFAKDAGSVAAPTAGLHFTTDLLRKIGSENISNLTLHVGAGTFMPVLSKDARDHAMHGEQFAVSVGEIRRIIKVLEEGKPLVVVGTTSSRTLESLFWCGVKALRGMLDTESSFENLKLGQFEWVPLSVGDGKYVSAASALKALVADLPDDEVLRGETSLMITPESYHFRVVDHLITNFHAPDSTLMLLVSSFLGNKGQIRTLYEDAQKKKYRFLSYGDVCMFSRPGAELPGGI